MIIEAKERDDGERRSLLSLEAFQELINFNEFIYTISSPAPNGEMVSYYDLCDRFNYTDSIVEGYAAKACEELGEKFCLGEATEKCKVSPGLPIDFIYERKTDSYNLDKYKSNNELIGKI